VRHAAMLVLAQISAGGGLNDLRLPFKMARVALCCLQSESAIIGKISPQSRLILRLPDGCIRARAAVHFVAD